MDRAVCRAPQDVLLVHETQTDNDREIQIASKASTVIAIKKGIINYKCASTCIYAASTHSMQQLRTMT